MRRIIDFSILLLFCAYIALFFNNLFICVPIQKFCCSATPGHCGTQSVLPYTAGAMNVFSDAHILVLPIPCIWAVNMKIGRRLRVLSVFALGILYVPSTS